MSHPQVLRAARIAGCAVGVLCGRWIDGALHGIDPAARPRLALGRVFAAAGVAAELGSVVGARPDDPYQQFAAGAATGLVLGLAEPHVDRWLGRHLGAAAGA